VIEAIPSPERVSADDLPALIQADLVTGGDYIRAMDFFRDPEFWKTWAIRALLALAVGHILSGIIFFFAFNWNDLSGMTKFAVVGGGIFACLLAWIIAKLDSPAGQAFGIGATVLVGVMFAVLGQVYQTPALIHTPFLFWAVLTLPFALASRNLAHWTVWLAILVVAITTYINSGLRLAGEGTSANLLNIAVSGGFIAGLVLLDKIFSPRLLWARGEWFRVLLVLGAGGFAFFGFTESFWARASQGGGMFWIIAFALICGLLAYLYYKKPTLATLSLATFGLFTLVAQFGFKLFDKVGDDVGVFLMVFLWLGGLTAVMVTLFRHYIRRFKQTTKTKLEDDDEVEIQAKPISEFSQYTGLKPGAVSHALTAHGERDHPWYISVFLAFAGILTAIMGCAFVESFIGLLLSSADESVFGVLGLIIFAGAIFLRRKTQSPYLQHMLNTMILVGGGLAAFGFGIKIADFDGIVIYLLVLSLIVFVAVRDRILEFMSAAVIITLIGMELYHLKIPMVESVILIISTGIGVVLLTRPLRNRLFNAAGTALLIAPAILGIGLVHVHRLGDVVEASRFSDDWPARIISLVVLLAAIAYLNRGKSVSDFKPPVIVLAPLVGAAALVPLGGASALLLILAGYILGSRTLAIIGTLLQIYFLTMFYYDLSLDLLTKSIILFVSGLLFLGVWAFVRRSEEPAP